MKIIDRIHPNIAIHAQASGRHSTTDPPLAQLPPILHEILMPDEGEYWIGGDFSGQEVWIVSAEANDTPTLDALRKGWDSHTLALCDGMNWPYPTNLQSPGEDVPWLKSLEISTSFKSWRNWFKRVRLAMNYGKKSEYVYLIPGSIQLKINQKMGTQIANRYLEKHPALAHYHSRLGEEIDRHGIVRSFMGRRRILYDKGDKRQREGFNGPMQQGGADILNTTIVRVCRQYPVARYLYGVHDSFWFAFPKEDTFKIPEIQKIITQPFLINHHSCHIPVEWKFRGLDD